MIRLFLSFVSEDEHSAFTSPVTLSEIEGALNTFKKDKAPGPDGWTVEFYSFFLDLLGPLLVNMVES